MLLSTSDTTFPNFNSTHTSCVIFCEADKHLLFRDITEDSQAGRWGLPGGIIRSNEEPLAAALKFFQEQMKFNVSNDMIRPQGHRFARISGVDSTIHFFKIDLSQKPDQLVDVQWISIFALDILDQISEQIEGRQEAFSIMYNRLWHKIPNSSSPLEMTLTNGTQTVVFNQERKFVVNFIGAPHAGKYTQASFLKQKFGLADITDKDNRMLQLAEYGSPLESLLAAYKQSKQNKGIPVELSVGLLAIHNIISDQSLAGFTLRRFTETPVECNVFERLFTRPQDRVVHIHLTSSNEITQARIAKATNVAELKSRLTFYNKHESAVLKALRAKHSVHTIPQAESDEPLNVFHSISLIIEEELNAVATQQQSLTERTLAQSKTDHAVIVGSESRSDKTSVGQAAVAGTALIVTGCVIGYLLKDNFPVKWFET